jgi:vacuolar-type H+-ATPase subunit H
LSSAIEETVKALVEFESELDRAKAEVADAKRRAVRDASEWAEGAKSAAISRAQAMAAQRVADAKNEAEAEAAKIKKKGEFELKDFEGSISRKKSKASEHVRARLLGESN